MAGVTSPKEAHLSTSSSPDGQANNLVRVITSRKGGDGKAEEVEVREADLAAAKDGELPRKGLGKIGNIFACGTALFSDGYQNGVIGDVNTLLRTIYPDIAGKAKYSDMFSSTVFAGTVAGMLIFGFLADSIGRKFGMVLATLLVALFAALSAASYGAGGSTTGMLQALGAWRFFIGIGIGAEYPAGSVACSENTEDPGVKEGTQHGLFALATNSAIDWGFVFSAFVPLVFLWIFGDNHLRIVWRMSLGFGVIPPLLVLIWRMRMNEPQRFRQEAMTHANTPYKLIIKKYWLRFTALSASWFIYDFVTYPFGIYSSTIVEIVLGEGASLYDTFGWNVVIYLFYIPGTTIGALLVDKVGPKRLMCIALCLQSIFGFAMAGSYDTLTKHIGGFAVMYGIFLSMGEAGPGNCLGLLASKASPTAFRGKFYGGAAAMGKIGAFAGTWAFPAIQKSLGGGNSGATGPLYIGSGLAILSAAIAYFFIPEIEQNFMTGADAEFRDYLLANGYDLSKVGLDTFGESKMEKALAPGSKTGPAMVQEVAVNEKGDDASSE